MSVGPLRVGHRTDTLTVMSRSKWARVTNLLSWLRLVRADTSYLI